MFHVNLFISAGHWGAAVRIVPLRIPLPDELGLAPHVVSHVLGDHARPRAGRRADRAPASPRP